jgi:hypothetical protein
VPDVAAPQQTRDKDNSSKWLLKDRPTHAALQFQNQTTAVLIAMHSPNTPLPRLPCMSNEYFRNLLNFDWEKHKGPADTGSGPVPPTPFNPIPTHAFTKLSAALASLQVQRVFQEPP